MKRVRFALFVLVVLASGAKRELHADGSSGKVVVQIDREKTSMHAQGLSAASIGETASRTQCHRRADLGTQHSPAIGRALASLDAHRA